MLRSPFKRENVNVYVLHFTKSITAFWPCSISYKEIKKKKKLKNPKTQPPESLNPQKVLIINLDNPLGFWLMCG